MRTKNKIFIAALSAILLFGMTLTSCRKSTENRAETPAIKAISEMNVPDGFTFETRQQADVLIRTLDNSDHPVPGVRVDVYTDFPENNGAVILSGVTDALGVFQTEYVFPKMYDSVVVGTTAIGFVNFQKVSTAGGSVQCTLGGRQQPKFKDGEIGSFKSTNSVYVPLGTYNSQGVPNYLTPTNDPIDAAMLNDINATLPEYISLPTSHPQFFDNGLERNLVLEQACDVWVTFVHEGAGYRNVLGFYTFTTGNPPATVNNIDSIHIIFPNVSFSGSGGGLSSGNRVHIGTFPPNTEIGWVLIADGYRNNSITNGNWVLYSDDHLNPEANVAKKQHSVLLNDIGRGKFLLAFEDLRRDGSCDNDFNDAVFYVTANPVQAINPANVPLPSYSAPDGDGDGVSDNFDDYPSDPTRAFNNYYPSKNAVGTLAFEDLWPGKGDYDFNDMVIDYNINQVTNGQNKVVEIKAKLILKAMGASFKNGFGIQLPVSPSLISSVTGTRIHENYIVRNSNGTEAGQSLATIIVFDNGYKVLPYPGSSSVGINTTPGDTYVQPDTINLVITMATPTSISGIGTPPYNPFLIVNQNRGREVHLVNHPPTDLADPTFFGTYQDDSNPATGRYYVSENNLAWAIDVAGPFSYAKEKVDVSQAYLKFIPWAESGGNTFFDWYVDKANYRNSGNLYSH
jgi:LruC domain-containing protein